MENETAYMLGAVLTVFAVTYALRALPFLLFAGRDRALPPWVERTSAFVSPVIIAGLIVYSFAGLSWRTPCGRCRSSSSPGATGSCPRGWSA